MLNLNYRELHSSTTSPTSFSVIVNYSSCSSTILGNGTETCTGTGQSLTTNNTACTVLAETEGVIIQVVQGSSAERPVVGATVDGMHLGYCNNSPQSFDLTPATTNSTGWAVLTDGGFGTYYLNVHALGSNYTLSVSVQPVSIAYVTYNISTGNITTTYSYELLSRY